MPNYTTLRYILFLVIQVHFVWQYYAWAVKTSSNLKEVLNKKKNNLTIQNTSPIAKFYLAYGAN